MGSVGGEGNVFLVICTPQLLLGHNQGKGKHRVQDKVLVTEILVEQIVLRIVGILQ